MYIKYNSKYTNSSYLFFFLHNFKLKNRSYHRLKIIACDYVKQILSYRTTTLSQRDFTNSLAELLEKRWEGGRGEGGLNKLNQGKIIEIS